MLNMAQTFAARVLPPLLVLTLTTACGPAQPPKPAAGSGDEAFTKLAADILEDTYRRAPTQATYLGIHKYDDKLEDYSRQAVGAWVEAARRFRSQLDGIDPATLTLGKQLDREQLMHSLDSRVLTLDVIRPWAKDPDTYSSGVTNTAYIMIKRSFAPLDQRLKLLIEREKLMPEAFTEARTNLDNPPRVYVEIAIQQIDGNREFFKDAVTGAFKDVKDAALMAEFKKANTAVIAALMDYKTWLQKDLLPRAKGEFAFGAETYRKKLAADEMIDTPLDELLKIAETNLRQNQAAFAEAAKKIDPAKTPSEVLALVEKDHPPADKLLSTSQGTLDALAAFITDHHIATIPKSERARVEETPPFLRATTFASMDTPGPFEKVATEAYYNVTLPDPKWPRAEAEDYMRGWYYPLISNVSVHEVWPGHYLQFLYAKDFPSDTRKVFGANSNSEGWAHYCEQMMIDEGFHADDPKYRLAQLQDALLRNARFIVGIRMHTQGMTLEQAREFFVKEGYQPAKVAESETKRGTSDATYGYYTMGKLMILKLRDDYKAKMGPQYTLQGFHDAYIKLGPLPLPLMRRAMLGDIGKIF
jgi:uncharacterized protein (DUF885 family)